nr:hypothetical transcript [Hymenolepis microstoma]
MLAQYNASISPSIKMSGSCHTRDRWWRSRFVQWCQSLHRLKSQPAYLIVSLLAPLCPTLQPVGKLDLNIQASIYDTYAQILN